MRVKSQISSGWKEYKIGDLAIIDEKSLINGTPKDYTFKYISLADVNKGRINDDLVEHYFSVAPSRARRCVKKNDILMSTVRPNLEGFVRIRNDVKDTIASTGFAVISPNLKSDSEYIYQCLYSYEIRRQIYALVVGSNYPAINSSDVKGLKILAPTSLTERAQIAEIISSWDTAIEKTEKLIEAKEKRKRGLAYKLLFGKARTGKRKTAGFLEKPWFLIPNDWSIVKIGSVAREVSIKNQHSSIPVLSCTKYQGLVDSLKYFEKQIFSEDTSAYKVVEYGQFAYATNHIEEGSIGYQNVYPKGLVSPMYTVFKTDQKQVNDGYLYKLLKTDTFRHIFKINTSSSVDRRGSLRWTEFSKLSIPLPTLTEQTEINEVLDTVQQEIDLLKNQVEAYRKQKRGLMQKLLTGKWRVKTREDVLE